MEVGVAAEFAGPVGAAVGVAVIIIAQFVEAGLEIEKLEEHINLTDQERHDFYWNFFLSKKIPDYIERDIEAKGIYEQYVSKIIDQFKDKYNTITISLPAILIKEEKYATDGYSSDERQALEKLGKEKTSCVARYPSCKENPHAFFLKSLCRMKTRKAVDKFDFSLRTNVEYSLYARDINNYSRVIPNTTKDYSIVCGPSDTDIKERVVRTTLFGDGRLPDREFCSGRPFENAGRLPYNNMVLSTMIKKCFFQEYLSYCNNTAVYKG